MLTDPRSSARIEFLRRKREKSRARRAAGLTQAAERVRYATNETNRRRRRAATQRWRARNAEKIAVQHQTRLALRRGELIRQPCERCGARAHAHHADYAKPLEVTWLCPLHHMRQHAMEGRLDGRRG